MLIRGSFLVLAVVASGCATIRNDASQVVQFDSSPNGARIFVNGVEVGTTPLSMRMKRSRHTIILAKKDGYEDQHMIEYSPNQYYIRLNRIPLSPSQTGGVAVDRGARTRVEQESGSTEARVRTYILKSDVYLRHDISRGHGEYLSGLNSLLRLPESAETLKRLRALAARNRKAPSFADAILSEYPAK
jgi:hypothetical protein